MKNLTKQFMQDNCGCYSQDELMSCSFMKSEEITLDSILTSEIPLKDKFWFVCRKLATKEQNQQIAIFCAETVLFINEDKHPYGDRPRRAIKAAKDYLAGAISIEELLEARLAAFSAFSATYADAAYYAYYAATAAAYADTAYDATFAVASTSRKNLNEMLLKSLIEFCKNNNL